MKRRRPPVSARGGSRAFRSRSRGDRSFDGGQCRAVAPRPRLPSWPLRQARHPFGLRRRGDLSDRGRGGAVRSAAARFVRSLDPLRASRPAPRPSAPGRPAAAPAPAWRLPWWRRGPARTWFPAPDARPARWRTLRAPVRSNAAAPSPKIRIDIDNTIAANRKRKPGSMDARFRLRRVRRSLSHRERGDDSIRRSATPPAPPAHRESG